MTQGIESCNLLGMKSAEQRNSFLRGPKYLHIAERLRQEISDGIWAAGARLPVERDLADTLAVSVNTLRRAVGELVADGLVERRQGAGTFVLPPPPPDSPTAHGQRLIGVLVPSTTYYYPRVVDGIRRVLRAAGAGVVLASSEYDTAAEERELRALLDSGVEGLLLTPNLHLLDDPQAYVDRLRELPVPHVLVERRPTAPAPDDATPYVVTDHAGGVCRAVRHLRTLGHRRVGHLGQLRSGTSEIVTRGFHDAAELLGVEVPEEAVARHERWTAEDLAEYARRCAATGVTAVFCHGDRDAAAFAVQARRHGLGVPGDVAVVAYDDEVADVGDVPLTAMSPPKAEVGARAAELLLRRLDEGPDAPVEQVRLQPRLVVRASCGAAREGEAGRPSARGGPHGARTSGGRRVVPA